MKTTGCGFRHPIRSKEIEALIGYHNCPLVLPDCGLLDEIPDPARKLSTNLYVIYHCCVYSAKLLMMDRGTVRNMKSFFYLHRSTVHFVQTFN